MFVSYAQNFEDIMLWRALKSQAPGFYVDVGAQHPIFDSVTRAFYERGWRGINIDALPEYVAALRQDRPEDTNLETYIGATDGDTEFFRVKETGMSTSLAEFADRHRAGGFAVESLTVRTCTLTSILAEAGIENDRFHFLKVDVEGAEGDVFRGLDMERYRPWIVLVESTEPGNCTPTHEQFEPLILAHRYEFVYFDGLNRFYLAAERVAQLRPAFATPPNVFDGYVLWRQVEAGLAARDAGELTKKNSRKRDVEVEKATRKVARAAEELYGSRRWRWGGWLRSPFSKKRRAAGFAALDSAIDSLKKTTKDDPPPP
jgi:FkbM family methyltransferase